MLYSIEREIEKADYEQLSNYTGDKEYKVYIIGMPQTNFIIAGKECNDKKQAVIRQNTILGVLKKYKENKTKRQGKVTRLKMGLRLNHIYWWPETRPTFGGSHTSNALNTRSQQRKTQGTPQPANGV